MIPRLNQLHGDCECCTAANVPLKKFLSMAMCESCHTKELELQAASDAEAEMRVMAQRAIVKETILVKADFFNAATQSIVERRKAIDESGISNPNFVEAESLMKWFENIRDILLPEVQNKAIELQNTQKAIQVRFNQLNQVLRKEEQDKLQLKNINYQPKIEKAVSAKPKVSRPKTFGAKEQSELRSLCASHNIPLEIVRGIMVGKGLDAAGAIKVAQAIPGMPWSK